MGLLIGMGSVRDNSGLAALGIKNFRETNSYPVGKYVLKGGVVYRFTSAHEENTPWDADEVQYIGSVADILSAPADPRMKPLAADNLAVGDMLFYDKLTSSYVIVKKAAIAAVLADFDTKRYETNHDIYIGTIGGAARFVAKADAMPSQSYYDNTVAATGCYYRVEIDNTQAGSITFYSVAGEASWAIGSAASPVTVSWAANEAMTTIVGKFTALNKSYNTFAALADGKGVGLMVGGYGANTMTVTASSNCDVIDCSKLAFYRSLNPAAPGVGGTFNPNAGYTLLGNAHHNFRGNNASAILTGKGLVGANSTCIGNNGFDYSYRTGINFAKWKSWASANGSGSFVDDGEGSSQGTHASVMNKAGFEAHVQNYSGSDNEHLYMQAYYYNLFHGNDNVTIHGDVFNFSAMKAQYEAWYGQMTTQYDAYLMSHCMKIDAASGITYTMLGKGKNQTDVKADCMNVTYDYVIIPAYPPEYNAHNYGIADSEGFAAGTYYHPEPADIGLFLRDDIISTVNSTLGIAAITNKLMLDNATYRGSSADYDGNYTWFFNGYNGCFSYYYRYYGNFRCRPVLALPLS